MRSEESGQSKIAYYIPQFKTQLIHSVWDYFIVVLWILDTDIRISF